VRKRIGRMLKRLFTENLEIKLAAFAMAVALWWFAINEHHEKASVAVPVEIKKPEGVEVEKCSADKIYVVIEGPQRRMREFHQSHRNGDVKVVLTVDLPADNTKDEWPVSFKIDSLDYFVGIPDLLRLKGAPEPDTVNLVLTRLMQKSLPVKLNIVGDPPPGYEIVPGSMGVFPGVVTVRGTRRVLEQAEFIETLPIDLSKWPTLGEPEVHVDTRVGTQQSVKIKDKSGKMKAYSVTCDETVRCWIKLVEARETKTLKKLPIHIMVSKDYPYEVKPLEDEVVEASFTGPRALLGLLNEKTVLAYVNVAGLRPSKIPYTVQVRFALPEEAEGKVFVVQKPSKIGVDITERAKPQIKAPPKKK